VRIFHNITPKKQENKQQDT